MQADIDYDQILVPITGSRISDEMMVLACQLATEKKSSIDGLYVIEVPLNLPLDATPRQRARQGRQGAQGGGGLIASQFKVKFTPHVVTARQAGRAIVRRGGEPGAARSSCVGTTRKRRIGNLIFGRTTDYVLDHAPCEVLLNLVPRDYPTEGSSVTDALEQRGPTPPAAGGGGQAGPSVKD